MKQQHFKLFFTQIIMKMISKVNQSLLMFEQRIFRRYLVHGSSESSVAISSLYSIFFFFKKKENLSKSYFSIIIFFLFRFGFCFVWGFFSIINSLPLSLHAAKPLKQYIEINHEPITLKMANCSQNPRPVVVIFCAVFIQKPDTGSDDCRQNVIPTVVICRWS